MTGGEKIVVDHPSAEMGGFLADLSAGEFVLLKEIRGSSSGMAQEVIVATRQIALVRAMDADSRQSTTFRPKR